MAQNWGSKSRLRKTRSVEVVRFSAGMLCVSSKEFKTNTYLHGLYTGWLLSNGPPSDEFVQ